jgi:predicted ATPase/DNA-binding winged helix-turn-helix (wHTH) protein
MSLSYISGQSPRAVADGARGGFVLLPDAGGLRIDGRSVRLGVRAHKLLMVLAAQPERVVSRGELISAVWPRERVNENNLNVQIAALRKALGPGAIATIPGRGYRLMLPAADAPPVPRAHAAVPAANPMTNLPNAPGELLGREADLAELRARLEERALITLVGAGGIGKTRLAIEAARARLDAQPDGVWWVELATLAPGADAGAVARAVAAAVGLSLGAGKAPGEALGDALRPLAALIVLDNAEHVAPAVAQVVDSMRGASALRWLVTSQLPLRLGHEQLFALGALSVPPPEATYEQAMSHGAIALLMERAHAANHRYELSEVELPAAIAICWRLDGIALAIEMAAARLAWLGADALNRRLARSLRGLAAGSRVAPTRQQTLQAALDWSHGLLTSNERSVLRKLGVFVGGFTLQTAQHVATDEALDEWAVLDALEGLADKSWVKVGEGDAPRYHLLESARLHALEQLADAGEVEAARARHCAAMDALATRHFGKNWALPREAWATPFQPECDNFVIAFDWALGAQQFDAAARLFVAMECTFKLAGRLYEIVERANALEPMLGGLPATLQAHALAAIALTMPHFDPTSAERSQRSVAMARRGGAQDHFVFLMLSYLVHLLSEAGSPDEARAAAAEARAMRDAQWPPYLMAQLASAEAWLSYRSGDLTQALRLGRAAVAQAQSVGATYLAGVAGLNLALFARSAGQYDEAIAINKKLLVDLVAPRHSDICGYVLNNLCNAYRVTGALDLARSAALQALPLMRRHGAMMLLTDTVIQLALRLARPEIAAQLSGYMQAQASSGKWRPTRAELDDLRSALDRVASALGPDELERWLARGAALDGGQIDALVRDLPEDAP